MKWEPLDYDNLPEGPVLVTNNLHAKNALGSMSHVWAVPLLQQCKDADAYPREIIAFDGWHKLRSLTHYCEIPTPAAPTGEAKP